MNQICELCQEKEASEVFKGLDFTVRGEVVKRVGEGKGVCDANLTSYTKV